MATLYRVRLFENLGHRCRGYREQRVASSDCRTTPFRYSRITFSEIDPDIVIEIQQVPLPAGCTNGNSVVTTEIRC